MAETPIVPMSHKMKIGWTNSVAEMLSKSEAQERCKYTGGVTKRVGRMAPYLLEGLIPPAERVDFTAQQSIWELLLSSVKLVNRNRYH